MWIKILINKIILFYFFTPSPTRSIRSCTCTGEELRGEGSERANEETQRLLTDGLLHVCVWLIHSTRHTVTAGSDHYFHTCHISVHPYVRSHFSKSHKTKQLSSENSDRYKQDCGSGRVDHLSFKEEQSYEIWLIKNLISLYKERITISKFFVIRMLHNLLAYKKQTLFFCCKLLRIESWAAERTFCSLCSICKRDFCKLHEIFFPLASLYSLLQVQTYFVILSTL